MKSDTLVATSNVRRLGETIEKLASRRQGAGALGLVSGPPGTGKSSAARMIANQFGGVYYSLNEVAIAARPMLSGLAHSICGYHVPESRTHHLFERCLNELEDRGRPIICVDEADRLDRRGLRYSLIDILRDLHDLSGSPIVFFSVGRLQRLLANPTPYLETLTSRLGAQLQFERASQDDCELLAKELLDEGIAFDPDLIAHCLKLSGGSIRPLLGLYAEIETVAKAAGIRNLSLAKWERLGALAGMAAAKPQRPPKSNSAHAARADVRELRVALREAL